MYDRILDPGIDDVIRVEYTRAVESIRRRDLRDATRRLQSLPGDLASARNLLGVLAAVTDQGAGAVRYFQEAIALRRGHLAAWINLGALYFRWKKWNELEALADGLENVHKGHEDALLGHGLAAYGRREYQKAAGILARARDMMERTGNPRITVARVYLQRAQATRRRVFRTPAR